MYIITDIFTISGVVFTDGPLWQEQRRFCLQHLRKLGLGKRSMDEQIEAEVQDLVATLQRKCDGGSTPLQLHDAFNVSVLNSLWALLAGYRFALDDKRLMELLDIVHASFRMVDASGGLLNQMPFLRYVVPNFSGYNQLLVILNRMWGFVRVSSTHRCIIIDYNHHAFETSGKHLHYFIL
jgi:methyl farnesoate epoxidase/farnesoate epoxidase